MSDRITDTRGRKIPAATPPAAPEPQFSPEDFKSASLKKIAKQISDDFQQMHEEMVDKFDSLNDRFGELEARITELENKPVASVPTPESEG